MDSIFDFLALHFQRINAESFNQNVTNGNEWKYWEITEWRMRLSDGKYKVMFQPDPVVKWRLLVRDQTNEDYDEISFVLETPSPSSSSDMTNETIDRYILNNSGYPIVDIVFQETGVVEFHFMHFILDLQLSPDSMIDSSMQEYSQRIPENHVLKYDKQVDSILTDRLTSSWDFLDTRIQEFMHGQLLQLPYQYKSEYAEKSPAGLLEGVYSHSLRSDEHHDLVTNDEVDCLLDKCRSVLDDLLSISANDITQMSLNNVDESVKSGGDEMTAKLDTVRRDMHDCFKKYVDIML